MQDVEESQSDPQRSLSTPSFPCGIAEIEAVLPHRHPFLWMTRVLTCEPGVSIEAELDVDASLPVFGGHFPEHPVFPGVLLMESLAQAASFCILIGRQSQGSIGYLTGIDKARFRHQVLPDDTVKLKAQITRSSSRMCIAEVEALVGGELCASATQKYVIA